MLQWWEAALLGSVQGFSEFLPISSTGHIILIERIFSIQGGGLSFDIFVHFGTLLAVIFFFRRDLKHLFFTYWRQIFWATVPTVLFALLFKDWIEQTRESMPIMALSYLFNAIVLGVASILMPSAESGKHASSPFSELGKKLKARLGIGAKEEVDQMQAFLVGLFQALAIIPGISRSASTVSAGLLVGLSRETAFTFAFLISIPAVFGAIVFTFLEMSQSGEIFQVEWFPYLLAILVSGVTGYIALWILRWIIRQSSLWFFALYCLFVSILIVLFA